MSAPSRDGFPRHTTIARTVYPDEPPFAPPQPPRCSRLTRDDFSSGSTIVRETWDDTPAPDPHYADVSRDRERDAREIARAARDSILRPAHLADRETNDDLRMVSAARAASDRIAGGTR